MASNGSGKIPPDFDTFDRLPIEIREVLRYAPRNFAPATVEDSLTKYGGKRKLGMFIAHMRTVLHRRFPNHIRDRDRGY